MSGLTKIFEDLVTVADYSQRHLPAFVMQAVHMVFWISMIVGTLDNEQRNINHFKGQRSYSLLLFLVSNAWFMSLKRPIFCSVDYELSEKTTLRFVPTCEG